MLSLELNAGDKDDELCKRIYEKVYEERSKLIRKISNDVSRDYVIHHIALACESMGHVSLYDYDENNWKINIRSLYNIVDTFKNGKTPIEKPENYLIRALFYYKAAAYMYNLSCERGLSVKCHKEMLYTLEGYNNFIRLYRPTSLGFNLSSEGTYLSIGGKRLEVDTR